MPHAGSSTVSPNLGLMHLHHEPHDRPRRVELAGVARGVAHLAEHRFVEAAERVELLARVEVDAVDLVDDVPQQIAVLHPILDAAEDGRDHVAPVAAVCALQAAEVGKEAGPSRAIWTHRFLIVDEGDELVPVIPPSFAAQSRQRYGGSIAGLKGMPLSSARVLRAPSKSSRNFKNMIQVSMGRRSRSPLSPLSFRMMSRADLMMLPSCCAVVCGSASFLLLSDVPWFSFVTIISRIQASLQVVHCFAQLRRPTEESCDLRHVAVP